MMHFPFGKDSFILPYSVALNKNQNDYILLNYPIQVNTRKEAQAINNV